MDYLKKRFGAAGLQCEILSQPIRSNNPAIFQMDIDARNRRERFVVWPGHADNRVQALGIDRDQEQLVLFVSEVGRAFREEIYAPTTLARKLRTQDIQRAGGRVLGTKNKHIVAEFRTRGAKRHMLCGMDEAHLFVAELPRPCTTVRDAHEALMASEIRVGQSYLRQGEWFFVEPSRTELADLSEGIAQRKAPIGVGGNPHVADELVRVRNRAGERVYVRGRVRHVDHKTLKLRKWMRVFRNREAGAELRSAGIFWVD